MIGSLIPRDRVVSSNKSNLHIDFTLFHGTIRDCTKLLALRLNSFCETFKLIFILIFISRHCYGIAVTSQWAPWRLKSPASRLSAQPFFQAHIKKTALRHWPLWVESTVDPWILLTRGQQRRKCFHLMTSSWELVFEIPPHRKQWSTYVSQTLSEPMLGYCPLDLKEQTSVKFQSKHRTF